MARCFHDARHEFQRCQCARKGHFAGRAGSEARQICDWQWQAEACVGGSAGVSRAGVSFPQMKFDDRRARLTICRVERRVGMVSIVVLCVLSGLVTRSPVRADSPTLPESFDVRRIDLYLAAQVREKGRVGLSVAIVTNGQIALIKGYGSRSLREQQPVEVDTKFAIGSVTKQFTCACVLLLAQEGKLSVNDKVSKYFPKLTRARDITLLDLMSHTSGYPDYYPLDFVDTRMQKGIAADDLIQQYAGGRLDFAPGSEWSYSNTGFIILGRVVEKVSGRPFAEFLESRILKPLGLEHTTYGAKPTDKSLATGYTSFALSAAEPAMPEADGWVGAAGALNSTPSDLAKWDLGLMEGMVLKPKFFNIMKTSR